MGLSLRILFSIPVWALMFLLEVFLILVGFVVIPIAAACKAYNGKSAPSDPTRLIWHFTWPFMFLWDNYEDGIANDTYVKFQSMFMKICYWSCWRNPVNNLRIVHYVSVRINPQLVQFYGSFCNFIYEIEDEQRQMYANGVDFKARVEKYDTKIPQWFFAWCGYYSNFYWQFQIGARLYRFWIGWKIYPTDIFGVTLYRRDGAGFAIQLKRIL